LKSEASTCNILKTKGDRSFEILQVKKKKTFSNKFSKKHFLVVGHFL